MLRLVYLDTCGIFSTPGKLFVMVCDGGTPFHDETKRDIFRQNVVCCLCDVCPYSGMLAIIVLGDLVCDKKY